MATNAELHHAAPVVEPGVLSLGEVAALGEVLRRRVRASMQISDSVLDVVLATQLAGGHLLVEDHPGVGKTHLARTLASAIDGRFSRVQATVDLLPGDVVGANVWDARHARFEFRPGPVFANIVLVDELNRATPKTQSGLLEAMQERQVTIDGATHHIHAPFLVIATQNPSVGHDGTYPLPPAQLDRFLARISLGYPTPTQEVALLRRRPTTNPAPATTTTDLLAAQAAVHTVHASDPVLTYIVALLQATRDHPLTTVGASPRAGLLLLDAARARAALQARNYITPDDIQTLAPHVLTHRLQTTPNTPHNTHHHIIQDAITQVPAR
jgi:MoxR-like ATPase